MINKLTPFWIENCCFNNVVTRGNTFSVVVDKKKITKFYRKSQGRCHYYLQF